MVSGALARDFCLHRQPLIIEPQRLQGLVVELLEIEQDVARFAGDADQLVDLDMHGGGVAVLGILDHEHHQEGDDGGAGIDDQLPRIAISEQRSGDRPQDDDSDGSDEGERSPGQTGGKLGEVDEPPCSRSHVLFLCFVGVPIITRSRPFRFDRPRRNRTWRSFAACGQAAARSRRPPPPRTDGGS